MKWQGQWSRLFAFGCGSTKAGRFQSFLAHPGNRNAPALFWNLFFTFMPTFQNLAKNSFIRGLDSPYDQIIPRSVKSAKNCAALGVPKPHHVDDALNQRFFVSPPSLEILSMSAYLWERAITVTICACIGFEPSLFVKFGFDGTNQFGI